MSRLSRYLPISLGLLSAGALVLAALSARSQTPPGTSTYAASSGGPKAAPPESASASGSAAAAAPKDLLRGTDIPAEASDMPKDKKDWDAGKTVSPNSGVTVACTMKILREWLRFDCEPRIGAALVAGEPADVKVWAWGNPFGSSEPMNPQGPAPKVVIVIPVRRGESKILDLNQLETGWDWAGPGGAERISLAWRDGSEDPVLIVSSPP